MGAWGLKSFDNDEACDWLIDFEDHGIKVASSALDAIAGSAPEEMGASLECRAIAAAEVVAAAHDGDVSRLPGDADKALDRHKSEVGWSTLVPIASNAIERIMNNSKLRGLWADVEAVDEWLADLAPLKTRLNT